MPSRTDEMISKGMGAVKGVKAMFEGVHGVFKTLMEQHGEVSALLRRCKAADDDQKRADLWPKIRSELLSHERAEIQVVYPALRGYDALRELSDEHDRDADELERQIRRLDGIEIGSDEWGAQFDELVNLFDAHVKLEESDIFPKADDVIGEDRADELDSEFISAKQSVMATA